MIPHTEQEAIWMFYFRLFHLFCGVFHVFTIRLPMDRPMDGSSVTKSELEIKQRECVYYFSPAELLISSASQQWTPRTQRRTSLWRRSSQSHQHI